MKVVFLFMSTKPAEYPDQIQGGWEYDRCSEEYSKFNEEGYFYLLRILKEIGVITDLKVFYESGIGPGKAGWIPGSECFVVPHISLVDKYIEQDTIIFVRGGFKHWYDWLLKYKGKNWLMVYAANTGRHKWDLWDVVLNDLEPGIFWDSIGRLQYHFIKPTHPGIFRPDYHTNQIFDVCIGASHIHDKKGQWRSFEVLKEYERIYGKKLNAVMPGSYRRSFHTSKMIEELVKSEEAYKTLYRPGMVCRNKLAVIFNRTKLFLHLGEGGQNDRSVLEALSCGTRAMIASPSHHAVELIQASSPVLVPEDLNDYTAIANMIHRYLEGYVSFDRNMVTDWFDINLGFEKSVTNLTNLLSNLSTHYPGTKFEV